MEGLITYRARTFPKFNGATHTKRLGPCFLQTGTFCTQSCVSGIAESKLVVCGHWPSSSLKRKWRGVRRQGLAIPLEERYNYMRTTEISLDFQADVFLYAAVFLGTASE